jgi:hypothetical protein
VENEYFETTSAVIFDCRKFYTTPPPPTSTAPIADYRRLAYLGLNELYTKFEVDSYGSQVTLTQETSRIQVCLRSIDEESAFLTLLVFHKPSCMEHSMWLKISDYLINILRITVKNLYIQGSNTAALCMQARIESFIKEMRF